MGIFSDILLTSDFDRTLTRPDGSLPANNIEAIRYFIENGGSFTVNTGRNLPMSLHNIIGTIPMNAPFLFAEGCGMYDVQQNRLIEYTPMPIAIHDIIKEIAEKYPYINQEIHCPQRHIRPGFDIGWDQFNRDNKCSAWGYDDIDNIQEPILRLILRARISVERTACGYEAKALYHSTPEEDIIFQQIADEIEEKCGDQICVFRANQWITSLRPKTCSKLIIARKLQQQLGKKILVCIGDEKNDLSMLEGADYAFSPSGSTMAQYFPNVCPCAEGSVADLIYNEIPRILKEREHGNLL